MAKILSSKKISEHEIIHLIDLQSLISPTLSIDGFLGVYVTKEFAVLFNPPAISIKDGALDTSSTLVKGSLFGKVPIGLSFFADKVIPAVKSLLDTNTSLPYYSVRFSEGRYGEAVVDMYLCHSIENGVVTELFHHWPDDVFGNPPRDEQTIQRGFNDWRGLDGACKALGVRFSDTSRILRMYDLNFGNDSVTLFAQRVGALGVLLVGGIHFEFKNLSFLKQFADKSVFKFLEHDDSQAWMGLKECSASRVVSKDEADALSKDASEAIKFALEKAESLAPFKTSSREYHLMVDWLSEGYTIYATQSLQNLQNQPTTSPVAPREKAGDILFIAALAKSVRSIKIVKDLVSGQFIDALDDMLSNTLEKRIAEADASAKDTIRGSDQRTSHRMR